jgi:hypothetical protein
MTFIRLSSKTLIAVYFPIRQRTNVLHKSDKRHRDFIVSFTFIRLLLTAIIHVHRVNYYTLK